MRKNAQTKHRKVPKVKSSWKAGKRPRGDQPLSVGECLVGLKMEIDQKLDEAAAEEARQTAAAKWGKRVYLSYKEVKQILDAGGKV